METNTKPKTIFLVEDDGSLNRAVMRKLEQKGNRVISMMRAEEALNILNTEHPQIDVIWLDLLLPGMNGLEFLDKIRKNPEYKDIKVVICSVSGSEESKKTARDLGVSDYLIKSDYALEALTEKVLSYA